MDVDSILGIICLFGLPWLVWPFMTWLRQRERGEARRMYERIAMKKLEVLQTGLAMGLARDDLRDLDARLEKLVGADKLQGLLATKKPELPQNATEMLDASLDLEREQIFAAARARQSQG